ncbi:hypothetical protein ABLG96_13850 [Nakamurella sp. A5-74]|uniref:VapC45 PIN like domain-containing protein n=1 Tax=Nakamurella sp. A5-74 TaxID=3158264 RepID=A0AAU8DM97_9ACTN
MDGALGPRFFIDRSMGAHDIPDGLRRAGWDLVTMRERYGEHAGQRLADPPWIADATRQGELIITKDHRVAKREAEARTIYMHDARVFAFPHGNFTGLQMLNSLIDAQVAIFRWGHRVPGPFVATIRPGGKVDRVRLVYP